jgi:hypothetical protein
VAKVRAIHESGFERKEGDFYPTQAWVTECLLGKVALRGPVWEPCCGDGAIAKVLTAAGHAVVATDLVDRGYGRGGVDFFRMSRVPDGCRAVITNPPYGDGGGNRGPGAKAAYNMLAFTDHAIRLARQAEAQLALLVRLQWIAGNRVASLLSEGRMRSVIVLMRRIQWFDRGKATKSAQHHHAWIFFDFGVPALDRPELIFADGPRLQQQHRQPLDQDVLPLYAPPPADTDG